MQHSRFRCLCSYSLSLLLTLALTLILLPTHVAHAASLIVTNTNDSGSGSLRQAIADAVSGDIITFSLPDHSTITLASELVVSKHLTINGPGAAHVTISGNNAVRVFQVNGGTLVLNGVTITEGKNSGGQGGGIYIHNDKSALILTNSIVSRNSAASGGGIFTWHGGALTVTNSTISGNQATGSGGGIYTQNGLTTVTNSTINGNTGSPGGGIMNIGNPQYAILTVTNSTISDNTTFGYGGGIAHLDGVATVTNSTISNNHAGQYDGAFYSNNSTPTLKNTILDNPSVRNCVSQLVIADGGGNVSSDAFCLFNAASSRNNVNPQLGPLQDNGGPTFTHALLNGSPAIDLIDASACAVTTDQRGAPRPQGTACDSGAFEYGSQVPTVTPTNTAVPPTNTPTTTNTPTITHTPTATATATNTKTATNTPSNTATSTRTATVTNSPTASSTPSNTVTATRTATVTNSPTASNTPSNTVLPTNTPTATRTATVTNSPTASNTPSNTVLPTSTATNTATATRTATVTNSPTASNPSTTTPTKAYLPTVTSSPTISRTASSTQITPSSTTTSTRSPTRTDTPTTSTTSTSSPTHTPTTGSVQSTVIASADSYVQKTAPKKNFGSKTTMIVDGTDDPREVYVRFTVSTVRTPIQKAVLRLYVTDGTKDGPRLYQSVNNTWSENTLTWNARPGSTGPMVGNLGKINDNVWVEYDVTALVVGNGTYSFVLTGDSTESVEFASRESSKKPQLVLTVQP